LTPLHTVPSLRRACGRSSHPGGDRLSDLTPDGPVESANATFDRPSGTGAADEQQGAHDGPGAWLRPAIVGCWLAGGVILVAVGVSGLVSELFGRLYGAGFVAGDAPGVTYTPDRCAEFLEYAPHAGSCAEAAAQHHWGEVVIGRVAAGVLGLLALLLLWALRRGGILGTRAWTPPRLAVALPLAAAFAAVGVLFTGLSVVQLAVHDRDMVGANLATGLVSLVTAIGVVIWLAARRHRQPPTH
jgi:hypothetical protein